MKPPYPYQQVGRCAGCGRDDVVLTRDGLPDIYYYRCAKCRRGHSSACLIYKAHAARFGGQMASCVDGCPRKDA